MNEVVKLIDCSHWQAHVPWDQLLENDWISAYIKADDKALEHIANARSAGFTRLGLYHWVDPTLSVEWNVSKVLEFLEKVDVEYVVPDIEHWWASWSQWWMATTGKLSWSSVSRLPGSQISEHACRFVEVLENRIDLPIINYSAAWFVNGYSPQMNTWIDRYPFINADYSYAPEGKTLTWDQIDQVAYSIGRSKYLPAAIKAEDIRQFASKIRVAETNDNYDMNIFFGDLDAFDALIGVKEKSEKPADPDEFVPYDLQFTGWFQWVRMGPSITFKAVDYLIRHQIVTVLEEQGNWVRIGENRWTHTGYLVGIPQKPKPIFSAKVTAYALNVRKGPGLNYDPIGHRLAGDIVEVYETSNSWARIGEGQWVSLNWIVRI